MALFTLVYAIIAGILLLKCYLFEQPWSDLWRLYTWLLPTPCLPIVHFQDSVMKVLLGEKPVASKPVLFHVLLSLHRSCSDKSVIKWRQIAHSANKFSENLGESPMVFFNGSHCRNYVDCHGFDVLKQKGRLFKLNSWQLTEVCNSIANDTAERYSSRFQSFCDELESLSVALEYGLARRKRRLSIKKVR